MILMIDNYDSFTYNIVQYLLELGADVDVRRNDEVNLDDIAQLNPEKIVISPGPCTPDEAGISRACIERFGGTIPILGICAGHQFMARFYGGDARESPIPEFGAMEIQLHDGGGKIFAGTSETQTVWESHNDEVHVVPDGFFVTASSPSCRVQGMENNAGDRFGLQFHPEVNDSEFGKEMFENFVAVCRKARDA